MNQEYATRRQLSAMLIKAIRYRLFRQRLLANPGGKFKVKIRGKVRTIRLAPAQAAVVREFAANIRAFGKFVDRMHKGSKVVSIISVWP